MATSADIRNALKAACPTLLPQVETLVAGWVKPVLATLSLGPATALPKTIADPIWGKVNLYPWELLLVDSPLLQRMRGVRQLGMVHLVYPAACHSRFEHSIGAVEAATRLMAAIDQNADYRRRFGENKDDGIKPIDHRDHDHIRLAALLHDVGHGPFSHATETLIQSRLGTEVVAARKVLEAKLDKPETFQVSEIIAVLIVLSEAMRAVWTHENFYLPNPAADLALAVAARLLGARDALETKYLSRIVSGPMDADKLDYMVRDAHHAGLTIGMDFERLINAACVITLTNANAPERLKAQVSAAGGKMHTIGITRAGLGAYEQLLVTRVFLFDRMYHHHKARSAEAMVRALVQETERTAKTSFGLGQFYAGVSDDTFIDVLGARLTAVDIPSGGAECAELRDAILSHHVYHRAFAFAGRFIAGAEQLKAEDRDGTIILIWNELVDMLDSESKRESFASLIVAKAKELAAAVPDLNGKADNLSSRHVLVDLPPEKAVVRESDILVQEESGAISTPNLSFSPSRWTRAYSLQKTCGYVFAPREYVTLVAFAAQIVFWERLRYKCRPDGLELCKTVAKVKPEWLTSAAKAGKCSFETVDALTKDTVRLALFRSSDIDVPDEWIKLEPGIKDRFARAVNEALPFGVTASEKEALVKSVRGVSKFVNDVARGGEFDKSQKLAESELQAKARFHLRAQNLVVDEGEAVGGGKTDLLLERHVIVENKVRVDKTKTPLTVGEFEWQARRYTIALCERIRIVLLAYRPSDEGVLLLPHERIAISSAMDGSVPVVQIRAVVPYDLPDPSRAKAPPSASGAPS